MRRFMYPTDMAVGETRVVRVRAKPERKACYTCYTDAGRLNVVVTRHTDTKSGAKCFTSKNYCDRCLPAQFENLRDEAMTPKRP